MVYIPRKINKATLRRTLDYTQSREFVNGAKSIINQNFMRIKNNLINCCENYMKVLSLSQKKEAA